MTKALRTTGPKTGPPPELSRIPLRTTYGANLDPVERGSRSPTEPHRPYTHAYPHQPFHSSGGFLWHADADR